MSVLIKGMDMPKAGEKLEIHIFNEPPHHAVVCSKDCSERKPVTVIPVPPHGRLIDADNFLKDFEMIILETFYDHEEVEEMIKDAPTIIEAEEGE